MFLSKAEGVFYLFFTDKNGKRRKVSTRCKLKLQAVSFLKEFKEKEYEQRRKIKSISLSAFGKEYFLFASGVITAKTQRTYLSAYKEFVRITGDIPLHSVGIREIEYFLGVKRTEASEWTARKYYTSLRTAFEKAVQWEFITENPFSKVKKPKVPELSPVYLTEKEFTLLLSAIKEKDFRELCITGAGTGMRLGELLSLKWQEVDFDRKVIYVRNSETFKTKSKKNRVVPMNNELIRVLMEKKISLRSESETIFSDKRGKALLENTVSQKFKRAVRCAGLNDKLHFHSLRHSFASALVSSGVSLFIVSKFLGHSSSKTTEVYSHLSPLQFHREVNNGLRELFAGIGTN